MKHLADATAQRERPALAVLRFPVGCDIGALTK
jgi:hypothetical protein